MENYVKQSINNIIKGFKEVYSEEDGCDEYGFLYWSRMVGLEGAMKLIQ